MTENLKKCTKCGKELPATTEYFHKDNRNKNGLKEQCKVCRVPQLQKYYKANKDKLITGMKKWQEDNPKKWKKYNKKRRNKEGFKEYQTEYNLKYNYNMTIEEYNNILASQNNRCAICNKFNVNNDRLHVDHNHKNGNIRGLLCKNCNIGLGNFMDDTLLLTKAIKYINYHKNLC